MQRLRRLFHRHASTPADRTALMEIWLRVLILFLHSSSWDWVWSPVLYGYYCLAAITSSYRLLAQVFYTTIRDLVNMMSYLKPRYLFKPLASLMLF